MCFFYMHRYPICVLHASSSLQNSLDFPTLIMASTRSDEMHVRLVESVSAPRRQWIPRSEYAGRDANLHAQVAQPQLTFWPLEETKADPFLVLD
jgi:hypothetical protein